MHYIKYFICIILKGKYAVCTLTDPIYRRGKQFKEQYYLLKIKNLLCRVITWAQVCLTIKSELSAIAFYSLCSILASKEAFIVLEKPVYFFVQNILS